MQNAVYAVTYICGGLSSQGWPGADQPNENNAHLIRRPNQLELVACHTEDAINVSRGSLPTCYENGVRGLVG
jgi:hypothetical protein